jgi:mono/diheme cytochrome c family protein
VASVARKSLLTMTVLAAIAVLAIGGFIWSGLYNIGADDPHTQPVHAVLETIRERSIEVRARELQVPDLKDPARITQGAGNYNAMCMGCHLAPGMRETEMSKGLYPAPPNLTEVTVDAAEAFWVIKHGIKATGMPAWGRSMQDDYIWNMAAFLQHLPKLDAAQYQALVDRSGGHEHGGGETEPHTHGAVASDVDSHAGSQIDSDQPIDESEPHAHPPGTRADHHKTTTAKPAPAPAPALETIEHRHADGTVESHPAPQADDGHDHEH